MCCPSRLCLQRPPLDDSSVKDETKTEAKLAAEASTKVSPEASPKASPEANPQADTKDRMSLLRNIAMLSVASYVELAFGLILGVVVSVVMGKRLQKNARRHATAFSCHRKSQLKAR